MVTVLKEKHPLSLEVLRLTKNFPEGKAVSNVSLELYPTDFFALIGPNSSGKTTLIKTITGLYPPTKGKALITGYDIVKQPELAKAKFGYVPDNPTGFDYLTGYEFLLMNARLKGLEPDHGFAEINRVLNIFPLSSIIRRRLGEYSRGNRQKLAFIASLINNPPLLLIDEPIVGLDPTSIMIFGKSLQSYVKKGGCVLMTTHILSFAQQYATKVGLLHKGRLVATKPIRQGTSLKALYQQLAK